MKEIELSQGQVSLVDDEDYEWLNQWNWHAWFSSYTQSFYAMRKKITKGVQRGIVMHREIMGLVPGDGLWCDHKNRNTLDNRRSNLRIANRFQNRWNMAALRTNTSGYKGVSLHKESNRWRAQIRANNKKVYLGTFSTAEEAYAAYCEAAKQLHGEFACMESGR